jgi:2-dehydropantoate 2-reductase
VRTLPGVRFVVFGAGAIGGVVGARLHQAGFGVTLIARGAHHDAIRRKGLTIEDPDATAVLEVDVADAPRAVRWSEEEVVLLAVKSQDSLPALRALRACAPAETPIVCLQNGVENERVALRLFANVYGAVVMVPTAHLEPGIVQAYGTTLTGVVDVGRYPHGADDLARQIVDALGRSRFESAVREDIMRFKHAKLVMNLGNAVGALCASGPSSEELTALAQEEGRAVLSAAGIDFVATEVDDVAGRWQRYGVREIAGRPRAGSSTRQSLARAAGSVESDYLNGEVVLLGRLHGIPTPVNELLQRSIAAAARDRAAPGSVSADELLAAMRSDILGTMRPACGT